MTHTTSRSTIVFFDSGVGGLPYLELARSMLPDAMMHYIADDAGFPYGNKEPAQVENILLDRVRRLRSRLRPDVLVIACNTASQIGLKMLRKAHPDLEIIGTVPAIKPAAAESRKGCIGVLATERTVADPYLDDLIARHASEVEVVKAPAQDLVSFVERRFLVSDEDERTQAVEPYVRSLVLSGVDRIVLACTHFLHLEKEIASCAQNLGGQDVEIVDSRLGVANRLVDIIESRFGKKVAEEVPAQSPQAQPGRFLLTGEFPFDPVYALWADRFGLQAPERL